MTKPTVRRARARKPVPASDQAAEERIFGSDTVAVEVLSDEVVWPRIEVQRLDLFEERLLNIIALCNLFRNLTHLDAGAGDHAGHLAVSTLNDTMQMVSRQASEALQALHQTA